MPTIKPTPLAQNFNLALLEFLKTPGIESYVPFVYLDTRDIPTLGIGFSLVRQVRTNNGLQWQALDTSTLNSVLNNTSTTDPNAVNLGLTGTQIQTLHSDLVDAANQLNGLSGYTNPFPKWEPGKTIRNILGWTITDTQAAKLSSGTFSKELANVKAWLNDDTVYTSLLDSREMVALASQAFNGPALISPGHSPSLRTAILDGNRAEAWYQIRYQDPSPAERRYAEAAMFGE